MLTITVARRPLDGTVARNALHWGCGGMNIDKCRIGTPTESLARNNKPGDNGWKNSSGGKNAAALREEAGLPSLGRWPANMILCAEAAQGLDVQSGVKTNTSHFSYKRTGGDFISSIPSRPEQDFWRTETGGASRYFKVVK